ncbi:putative transposase [Bacillus fengqiuensis]|nr:putative transposase [Bacillus fengqiuensis]
MIYNKKIKLEIYKEQSLLLDSQSKMCNWLYNQLFEMVETDYKNGNTKKLLSGKNLRNQVPILKEKHPFLCKVYSSPLKNTALRLNDAYDRFFDPTLDNKKPHYRSWKKKWFSLYYDEPNKGFKLLNDDMLSISFGKLTNEEHKLLKQKDKKAKKQINLTVRLKEKVILKPNQRIKTLRITKDFDSYYAVFSIEETVKSTKMLENSFIVFDPNHKNLAVSVGSDGKSYELVALKSMLKYWDKRIDELKSKRDKCVKESKLVITPHTDYWKPSNRWKRLNHALEKAYLKRREQIKLVLYRYAHFFSRKYDGIYIGDYVPTPDLAKYKTMKRAMLNQTPVGEFRHVLKWVQEKNHKYYEKVEERDTTKTCCVCDHQEKKDPTIRIFTCVKCGTTLSRDISSAVNIGKKAKKILPRSGYIGVKHPIYTVWWDHKQGKVSCGLTPSTGSSI